MYIGIQSADIVTALCGMIALAVVTFTKGDKKNPAAETETQVAQAGAIVWFNMDRVLAEYDMANDLRSVFETKANSINQEVQRRVNKFQKDANAFQDKINKGLMTSSTAEVQSANLQKRQNEFQQYAAQKQQEIAEEQQVMMNQLADAIDSFLKKYNEEKRFAMILATQGQILSTPVAVADSTLDVTDEILAGLNAEYIKTKAEKK